MNPAAVMLLAGRYRYMPRFFFHLRSPQKSLVDCEGMVLVDAEAARQEAARAVQNFFQPAAGRVHAEWEEWSIDVSDQRGRRLCSVAFADAAEPLPVASVEQVNGHASRSVVYLDIARAKREFSSLEDRMRKLVRRTSTLVERTRSEARHLYELVQQT